MNPNDRKVRPLISRRTFVGRAIASGGTFALGAAALPLSANESLSPPRELTAAIIGAGGIARFHAANQLTPYFRIRAVCDVDKARATSFQQEFAPLDAVISHDYRDLLERDDIDVFFVCTPDHWHTKITVDALRNGKDVYCEKPLTLTIDEGRLIRKVLQTSDRILQVGTQQRSDLNFQTAVALAHSGWIGAVKRVTVAIGGGPLGGPFQPTDPPAELDWNRWLGQAQFAEYIPERCHGNFRWWYEYSGGKMTDWGAHHVDIAVWALGSKAKGPASIEVVDVEHPVAMKDGMPTLDDRYNTATSFHVRCRLDSGPEIILRDNAPDQGFENGLLFECQGGRFFVNRGKLTGKPVEALQQNPLPVEALNALRRGGDLMNHVAHFHKCCLDRTEPISDAASHLRSVNFCHATNIAMRLGRELRWDGENEQMVGDDEANGWLSRPSREEFRVF